MEKNKNKKEIKEDSKSNQNIFWEKIQKKKKTIIIIAILLVFIAAYTIYGKYKAANPAGEYTVVQLEKKDLKKQISIDGQIVSDYEIDLASEIPGIISKIYVKEGQYVAKGKLLMKLKDSDYRNQVSSAYTNKKLAEATLQKVKNPNQNIEKDAEIVAYNAEIIKNDIAKLKSDLNFNMSTLDIYLDQILRLNINDYFDHIDTSPVFTYRIKSEIQTAALEEERKKLGIDWKNYQLKTNKTLADAVEITGKFELMVNNLYKTSIDFLGFSDGEIEQKEKVLSALNTAISQKKNSFSAYKDSLAQLENKLKISATEVQKLENNVSVEDINYANQQIKLAGVQASNAYLQLQKTNIRATRSGIVGEIMKEVGEYAAPSTPLVKVISKNQYIKALIPEVDISKIQLGMDVQIKIDAYGEKIFSGKIDFIYPSEKESQGIVYYEVKISLDAKEIEKLNILPGMSLEVFIIYEEKKSVIALERGVAKKDSQGYFVQILNPEKNKPIDQKYINKYFVSGFVGDNFVEVVSGFSGNETIIDLSLIMKK